MFRKKKPTGVFSFFALSEGNPLLNTRNKRLISETIHEGVCPPWPLFANFQLEVAFSKYTTAVYPWEWNSPTVLDMDKDPERLSLTWDAIFDYMQKKYGFNDFDALEETATSCISLKRDCAVFLFALKP